MAQDAKYQKLAAGDAVYLPCRMIEPLDNGMRHLAVALPGEGQHEFYVHHSRVQGKDGDMAVPCVVAVAQPSNSGQNVIVRFETEEKDGHPLTLAVHGSQVVKHELDG